LAEDDTVNEFPAVEVAAGLSPADVAEGFFLDQTWVDRATGLSDAEIRFSTSVGDVYYNVDEDQFYGGVPYGRVTLVDGTPITRVPLSESQADEIYRTKSASSAFAYTMTAIVAAFGGGVLLAEAGSVSVGTGLVNGMGTGGALLERLSGGALRLAGRYGPTVIESVTETVAPGATVGSGLAVVQAASQGGGALARVPDFADTGAAFKHYAKHAKGVFLAEGARRFRRPEERMFLSSARLLNTEKQHERSTPDPRARALWREFEQAATSSASTHPPATSVCVRRPVPSGHSSGPKETPPSNSSTSTPSFSE